MIHFVTVHFGSDRWIDIQLRNIARHTAGPYTVWGCLNDVDQQHASKFGVVMELEGEHGDKLNEIARRVSDVARPDDILVFIDSDAFPISDWVGTASGLMERYPLIAVRRDENLGDQQPHPSFAVTTVRFWNELGGDWSRGGRPWTNLAGKARSDAGSRILEKLTDRATPWYPLLRSNRKELHPVLFGVYADLVYHHGAGSRDTLTSVDRWKAGGYQLRKKDPVSRAIAQFRLERAAKRNLILSERVYEAIRADDGYVARFFLGVDMPDRHHGLS